MHESDLAASRCKIWPFDLLEWGGVDGRGSYRIKQAFYLASLSKRSSKQPRWADNQYSAELHLQRALEGHPWRARSAEDADILYAQANF